MERAEEDGFGEANHVALLKHSRDPVQISMPRPVWLTNR